ncbi:MFS transporter [Micromonospora sp. AMSO12t]|uniref:MFS transporter n=1 Tax=Micromonospora sp. AMSO12t TaxID=2650410 RepID=UPI00124B3F5C|nr:MFS transporter [Micromonospora sp. AMSO12t]KAB1140422.1 MFS transporter [Micromonospora sp. AMSO12t]
MSATEEPPARPLRLVIAAHAVSTYGSFLNMVALGLFTLEITGSAVSTGIFMAVRLCAGVLMGLVAGTLVSRYARARLMIGGDLLSAGALVLLVAMPSAAQPTMLHALAVLLGGSQTLWVVALRSGLPALVGPDDLARANANLVAARSVAMLLGFGSAGILVTLFGYHAAFLLDATSFVVSALLLSAVRAWRVVGRPAGPPTKGPRRGAGLRRLLPSVAPVILAMIAVRSVDAFGSASHNVGLPVYANLAWPDAPAAFAALFTTPWAVGSLVAGQWYARRAAGTSRPGSPRAFGVATCTMSLLFVLAFAGPPIWLVAVLALAAGMADGYAEISYTTRLQTVEPSRLPQLMGLASTAQNAGFGIGMIVSAFALDRLTPLSVVALAHGLALAAAGAFLISHARTPAHRPHRQRTQEVEVAP